MAELIEILLGRQTHIGPKNRVLDGGTFGHHLANTIDGSVLGGDACYRFCIVTYFYCRYPLKGRLTVTRGQKYCVTRRQKLRAD